MSGEVSMMRKKKKKTPWDFLQAVFNTTVQNTQINTHSQPKSEDSSRFSKSIRTRPKKNPKQSQYAVHSMHSGPQYLKHSILNNQI